MGYRGDKMIRLMIVDDQALVRDGLSMLLQLRPELEVVGTAGDGREAIQKTSELQPDIILMDIRMPHVNGVEGTRLVREQFPHIKVLMLTTFNDSELILEALEQGASGYLLKDMEMDVIVQAILTVQGGGVVLPENMTAHIMKELRQTKLGNSIEKTPKQMEHLTEREVEVLKELGLGLNNKEIAEKLFITERTVKNHVSNVISKLELRDRTQAAIFAVRYGVTAYT